MSVEHFDHIAIGTGPAAGTVAKKTAESGKSVAVIESRDYGGTCALRGCNPKKVYTNAANLVDQARRVNGKLATFDAPRIDWSNLLAFKQQFTQPVLDKSEQSFRKRGIATFHGLAKFTGPQVVEVDGRELHADRIFVAVGAVPRPLEFNGGELVTLSDAFLELDRIPPHVTFVGGGYIAMEFAHVVAQYGSRVVVIDRNPRPLSSFDPDLVDQLVAWSRDLGIEFRTDTEVTSVQREASGRLSVGLTKDSENGFVSTDLVVHAAGRVPHLVDLNLTAAGVEYDTNGIVVDEFMRSVSNRTVFAAGDCVNSGMPRLTPVANEEARAVVKNLFSSAPLHLPDYGVVPRVVFTSPCIASIGLSAIEAQSRHDAIDVRFEVTSSWGSVRKTGQTCAAYKLLVDKQSDKIVGAHLLGPGSDETINIFALAMKFGLTATNIKSTLFAYPTFAADVRRML